MQVKGMIEGTSIIRQRIDYCICCWDDQQVKDRRAGMRTVFFSLFIVTLISAAGSSVYSAQVDFDPELWEMQGASKVEYLGRECLVGMAWLKDVDIENGVIEVDVAVDGRRSYPGLIFRMQSPRDYERYYMRPHRTCGRYSDVHQYTPVINGIAGWQLYNGDGFTAGGEIPTGEWLHLKIEFSGRQARVFLGDMENPVLEIDELVRGLGRGTVGVNGPRDGTAYFSNFSWRDDDSIEFDKPPAKFPPPGVIDNWQIAGPYRLSEIDLEIHPDEQEIRDPAWIDAECAASGLVDIAKYFGRQGREPDVALARATVQSAGSETMEFKFGYSDAAAIFFNGKLLFAANSSYRYRDPSFLGIAGFYDALYLPMKKGENEILMMVAEGFGGWGFMGQDGKAIFSAEGIVKGWETEGNFRIPETALYDPGHDMIYVSNFDRFDYAPGAGRQSISKLSPDGRLIDPEWIKSISNPTGMAIADGTLYVLERKGLVEIDAGTGEIKSRYPLPSAGFLNDIAASEKTLYISDSRSNIIHRFSRGEFGVFLQAGEVSEPNGLHVDGGTLYIGSNGEDAVMAVDLDDGSIRTLAKLGPGIIDGIESDRSGRLLVSHWEGRLYRIDPDGEVSRLLDTTSPGVNIANFGYDRKRGMVIIPTFSSNSVVSYSLPR
jgi:outer membrane protein assembly factor BamB